MFGIVLSNGQAATIAPVTPPVFDWQQAFELRTTALTPGQYCKVTVNSALLYHRLYFAYLVDFVSSYSLVGAIEFIRGGSIVGKLPINIISSPSNVIESGFLPVACSQKLSANYLFNAFNTDASLAANTRRFVATTVDSADNNNTFWALDVAPIEIAAQTDEVRFAVNTFAMTAYGGRTPYVCLGLGVYSQSLPY